MSDSPRRTPVMLTFDDLTADLVWPKLLKAGSLALRPTRVGLALALIVLVMLVVAGARSLLPGGAHGAIADGLRSEGLNLLSATGSTSQPRVLAGELYQTYFATPLQVFKASPVVVTLAGLLIAAVWSILGGAIARTAACDFAFSHALSWPAAIGFALGKWRSLLGAQLTPLVLAWLLGGLIALGSLLTLRLPIVNVVGGALWGVALLASTVATIIVLAYTLGQSLLVPAIACEGSDAIDAIQRAYAFVLAKPLRLLMYSAIIVGQGLLLAIVTFTVIWLVLTLASAAARPWSGEAGARVLAEVIDINTLKPGEGLARAGVALWSTLLRTLGAAVIVSFYWTASTLLYLSMRRVVDGQDQCDVWIDALIPGTRARVPQTTTSPAPHAHAQTQSPEPSPTEE